MLKCSYCGKESSDGSTRCGECGTPLEGGSDLSPILPLTDEAKAARSAAEKQMLHGVLWCAGGIIVTLGTYVAAASSPFGGTYFVAWGAIVFGAVQFFRGRAAAAGRVKQSDQAQDFLTLAAQFEESDPAKAIAAYEEVIQRFPGTSASDEARRNIQTLQAHADSRPE